MTHAAPIDSYLAAEYVVHDGGREIIVRIGQSNPELDALLDARHAHHGVFITAANPRSESQPDAVNHAANERMRRVFDKRSLVALPHTGRATDDDWTEPGFFVLDLARDDALALATQFDQFAIVVAERGRMAELKFTVIGEASADDPR
jgi:Protein of unknown function (DUF3293)